MTAEIGRSICLLSAFWLLAATSSLKAQRLDRERTTDPEAASRPVPVLTGRVVMEDGTRPPDRVAIECVGTGSGGVEAYTDSRGGFVFQPGRHTSMRPDARVEGKASTAEFGMENVGRLASTSFQKDPPRCSELRATLPGFRSSTLSIDSSRQDLSIDFGMIVLRRLAQVEGTTISVTSLEAPTNAKNAFEKGLKRSQQRKWAEGEREFETAIAAFPRYAAAWFELGQCFEQRKKPDKARVAYKKALEADGKYVSPLLRLARMAADERNWKEVAGIATRIVTLNPVEFPVAYLYQATANYNMGDVDTAEKSVRAGIQIDDARRFPKAHHLLGVILAQKGDFAAATSEMKTYLEFMPNARDTEAVKRQLADLEARQIGNRGPR